MIARMMEVMKNMWKNVHKKWAFCLGGRIISIAIIIKIMIMVIIITSKYHTLMIANFVPLCICDRETIGTQWKRMRALTCIPHPLAIIVIIIVIVVIGCSRIHKPRRR